MDRLELNEIIAGGEDSYTEFKRDVSQRSDFASEMIAFANTDGGGLCTPNERSRLLQLAGLYHQDEIPVPNTSLADMDMEAFGQYYQKVYEQPLDTADVPLQPMLQNMRFLVMDLEGTMRLSLAGLLLFGKKPNDFLRYGRITAARWKGIEAGEEILDRQEITGRLPEQIDRAEKFILRNTRLTTKIDGVRQKDIYEYPRPALREVIVNAVAHRDYGLQGAQILLYIFDDRLKVRSPGALPNGVTLANIRTHYSKARNETIARVLFNLGYVNTLGSGIPRILRLMREHSGREADLELHDNQFLVRLWAPRSNRG